MKRRWIRTSRDMSNLSFPEDSHTWFQCCQLSNRCCLNHNLCAIQKHRTLTEMLTQVSCTVCNAKWPATRQIFSLTLQKTGGGLHSQRSQPISSFLFPYLQAMAGQILSQTENKDQDMSFHAFFEFSHEKRWFFCAFNSNTSARWLRVTLRSGDALNFLQHAHFTQPTVDVLVLRKKAILRVKNLYYLDTQVEDHRVWIHTELLPRRTPHWTRS